MRALLVYASVMGYFALMLYFGAAGAGDVEDR